MNVLEARSLTKHYSGVPAVRDVSFSIQPGDILGYLGPNGSGKSTTVKMLTGLLEPTHGEIRFRGENINRDPVAYKRRLGYVPEEANLYAFLTGWEYLEMVATLRRLSPKEYRQKAKSLLEDFLMYPHRHSAISSYSKGMRQRILLIAALMHDPDVLILDEPFSGLDVSMTLVLRQVVKLLAAEGKAIFFCSPVLEVMESGQDSGATELEFGAGGLLAVLAVPGVLLSLMLFDKYSSLLRFIRGRPAFDVYLLSIPDKYFFIVFSMVITGMVVVLKWDRILPGPQDFANLAPLPLRLRAILGANVTAILLAALLFAVDVNVGSSILYPLIVTAERGSVPESLAFMAAHAICVLLASAFTFFACLAVMGVLMSFLPGKVFRRLSMYVRVGMTAVLVAMLTSSFTVPSLLRHTTDNPWVSWLPPVWFLGLYQTIQGKATPDLARYGTMGWQAAAAAVTAGLLFNLVSYRRHFLRIPESMDRSRRSRSRHFTIPSRLLGWMLPGPFQRACYSFVLRALLRSEEHCLLFGGFAGLGLVAALQAAMAASGRLGQASGQTDLLSIPLIFAYCLIVGLRVVFEVPCALRANWVYQLVLNPEQHEAAAVAKKIALTFLLPAVILPCLPGFTWTSGWRVAVCHTTFVSMMSLGLLEILFGKYRKIPFACSLPSLQNHLVTILFAAVLGFFVFTRAGAALALWTILSPWRLLAPLVVWVIVGHVWRDLRKDMGDEDRRLIYEDRPPAEVERLNLAG
jgi:ABC-2 type transport system ATP-binding protein